MKFLTVILLMAFGTTSGTVEPFDAKEPMTEWELAKEKDGIKVFTRQPEGAKVKEFKAIITVTTDMRLLENLIDKVSEYPSWQANITEAETVNEVNSTERYIYYSTDVPWPVRDRDASLYCKKSIDNGVVIYTLISSPDHIAVKEDYIRIREAQGLWKFVPKDGGEIEVTYQFYGDPAGSIPNWLINMFIVQGPYDTLINLRRIVEG